MRWETSSRPCGWIGSSSPRSCAEVNSRREVRPCERFFQYMGLSLADYEFDADPVIVIEHHLEVIDTADGVIDLGPEGGKRGGQIVAVGTPEEIARHPSSHTGRFLRPLRERTTF